MLTFFRRIRLRLSGKILSDREQKGFLKSSQTRRFLLYAIGEIALVVIGILIALQINNWNEWRKERVDEKQLLENLKNEYSDIIDQIEYLNELRNRVLVGIESFHDLISSGNLSYNDHMMDSLLSMTLFNPTFNGQTGTQDILFAGGKIDIISNSELKKLLMTWSSVVEDMTEDEERLLQTYHIAYFPLISNYISYYDLARKIKFRNLQFSSFGKGTVKKDYPSLLKDPGFENLLTQRNLLTLLGMEAAAIAVDKAQEILALIKIELGENIIQ